MNAKKIFASLLVCFVVLASFLNMVSLAYGSNDPDIDYILKTAEISTTDPRKVTIEVDAQYQAIPCPKILFWQANNCSYHELRTEYVVNSINAALEVADVDYYVDAYDSRNERGWRYTTELKHFSHETDRNKITASRIAPGVNTTGYHIVTQNNLEKLLEIWNAAEANGDGYDYLIILYDGLIASGAPSTGNYWNLAYDSTSGIGISLSDEEYRRRAEIATELSKIPTMHLTPTKLTNDKEMYLDTTSYYDAKVKITTYRSYAESVADYAIVPGVDYSVYNEHSNHRLTTILMLNSLAFISPDYYLSLIDNDPASPTYGKFIEDENFPPSHDDFVSNMPQYHSYVAPDLALQVQKFITISKITYTDTLVPGLTCDSVELYYTDTDYDYEGDVKWSKIPDSDINLTITGDSTSGTKINAQILITDTSRNYYSDRIKMVINTTASPDLGIDGNWVDTNIGTAKVDYYSIDGNDLYHQEHVTPQVKWDIYNVSYDMGPHGQLEDSITGIIDNGSDLPYEVCKEGYSPRRVMGDTVEDSHLTVKPGYYLVGFTCDKPVLIRGENTPRPAGSVIEIHDINSIIVQSDIVLTAVYEENKNVHYLPGDNGTITGIKTETVRENRNPSGTTIEPNEKYAHIGFIANVDLTLNDGTQYPSGELIPAEKLTSVIITEDTIFTAQYARIFNVNYDAADHGTFTENDLSDNYRSEIITEGSAPSYGTDTSTIPKIYREGGYILTGFVCDKDVHIKGDSSVRTAGSVIYESEITSIIVDDDITLTAQYVYSVYIPTGVNTSSGSGWFITAMTCISVMGITGILKKKCQFLRDGKYPHYLDQESDT